MALNESDLKLFKKWLRGVLRTSEATVTFTKKDGTDRVMKCTTNPTYIMFKDPAILESKKERKVNEDVMPVYDIEAGHWKSFRWDSIKQVQITLKEELNENRTKL
jgi:WYL_2, Sm-like SH3 beta-barrel fold